MTHSNPILSYRVFIWSENPDELMKFYRDVLNFQVTMQLTLPDDYGYGFQVNQNQKIWIGKHSQVKGRAKEPLRMMVNFYADNVFEWYEKLKDRKDIQIIAAPFQNPSSTEEDPRHVFTFLDPDGNCVQFMSP